MKDIDIRNSLKKSYLHKYVNDLDSLVIEEFNISLGAVRADIAVINGVSHCYEIKSEKDSLVRLENQINEYNNFFEYVSIVTCEKFIDKVVAKVPGHCGIIKARRDKNNIIKFSVVRKAKKNYNIKKLTLVQSLWRNELIEILTDIKYNRSFMSKSKNLLYQIICSELSEKQLSTIVKKKLKARINWKADLSRIPSDDCSRLSAI